MVNDVIDPNHLTEHAFKYGRHDMERLGVFIEMPYMHGAGLEEPAEKPPAKKGQGGLVGNMYAGGPKTKDGTMAGYFDTEYRRIFEGEVIPMPPERDMEKKKAPPPWMPPGKGKQHSTPGDHYGTFGGIIRYPDEPTVEPPPERSKQKPKPNFYTNPGKKGGCGYANICMSPYPEHMDEPYELKPKRQLKKKEDKTPMLTASHPQPFFDDNPYYEETLGRVYVPPKTQPVPFRAGPWLPVGPPKTQGGCHAGMFEPFPSHMTERDPKREAKRKKQQIKMKLLLERFGKWIPHSRAYKNMFTNSILAQNVDRSVHEDNVKNYEPQFCRRMPIKTELE